MSDISISWLMWGRWAISPDRPEDDPGEGLRDVAEAGRRSTPISGPHRPDKSADVGRTGFIEHGSPRLHGPIYLLATGRPSQATRWGGFVIDSRSTSCRWLSASSRPLL